MATLHTAAARGWVGRLDKLLAGGADPNAADVDGWTGLHWACYRNQPSAVERLLREVATDPNVENDFWERLWTPLTTAACFGHADCVSALMACPRTALGDAPALVGLHGGAAADAAETAKRFVRWAAVRAVLAAAGTQTGAPFAPPALVAALADVREHAAGPLLSSARTLDGRTALGVAAATRGVPPASVTALLQAGVSTLVAADASTGARAGALAARSGSLALADRLYRAALLECARGSAALRAVARTLLFGRWRGYALPTAVILLVLDCCAAAGFFPPAAAPRRRHRALAAGSGGGSVSSRSPGVLQPRGGAGKRTRRG
jgi:ankyrin repeat protein